MRITVLGATGGTGTEVVRQALAAGIEVTAVVRDPARLPVPAQDGLRVEVADVTDPAAVRPLVAGRDAVISALGTHGRRPTTVCRDGARSVVAAMRAAGTRRLLTVSASGFHTEGDGPVMRSVVKPLLGRVLREHFADLRAAEGIVEHSGLDWTIVRPPRLTDKARTGTIRSRVGENVPGGRVVTRADLAAFLIASAREDALTGSAVFVAQ